jgi:glycosyltransferase involved in cell wall biosynthesis
MDLSIIIPVYNEEENIDPLYEELHAVLSSLGRRHEILFIDDGSTDTTWSRLQKLHERDPAVTLIRFRSNFGQSAAMKAGFDHARGNLIITMDADLQNDPHDIPDLLTTMEKEDLDVICGWRVNRKDNISKKLFSTVANRLRKTLTHEIIHDSGCTLRIYTKECTRNLELYGELHRYITAILLWKGYHVGEMKTNHRDRHAGKSK